MAEQPSIADAPDVSASAAGTSATQAPAANAPAVDVSATGASPADARSRSLHERLQDPVIARDCRTLGGMTQVWCADHHDDALRTPYEGDWAPARASTSPASSPACAPSVRRTWSTARPGAPCAPRTPSPAATPVTCTATNRRSVPGSRRPWPTQARARCSAGCSWTPCATCGRSCAAGGWPRGRSNAGRAPAGLGSAAWRPGPSGQYGEFCAGAGQEGEFCVAGACPTWSGWRVLCAKTGIFGLFFDATVCTVRITAGSASTIFLPFQ